MSLKKAYQYLFYKIYRFSENAPSRWWSEWKASSIMDLLLMFIIFSIVIYFRIFVNRYLDLLPNKLSVIISIVIICAFNYYIFNYKEKWRDIVSEFDNLPKGRNKLGGWVVLIFICLVLVNLFYSFYLADQIDWSQYR